jgi:hypothetical protein
MFTRPALPSALVLTMAIELGIPAVAGSAYFAVAGRTVSSIAADGACQVKQDLVASRRWLASYWERYLRCRAGSYLVALPGQLVFDTSSGCVPVKAPAAVVLPRSWYSSHAVA